MNLVSEYPQYVVKQFDNSSTDYIECENGKITFTPKYICATLDNPKDRALRMILGSIKGASIRPLPAPNPITFAVPMQNAEQVFSAMRPKLAAE